MKNNKPSTVKDHVAKFMFIRIDFLDVDVAFVYGDREPSKRCVMDNLGPAVSTGFSRAIDDGPSMCSGLYAHLTIDGPTGPKDMITKIQKGESETINVVWLNKKSLTVKTVVHECFHAAAAIAKDKGFQTDDEAVAYIVGRISGMSLRWLARDNRVKLEWW